MKRILSILFILLITTAYLPGQSLKFYNHFSIPEAISVSIDRGDNLFVADIEGSISKYNWEGQLLLSYSSKQVSPVTIMEAWLTQKIFVFYDDLQQFILLDRFMAPISEMLIPNHLIGYAKLSTIAPDNNFWVIDDYDFSLKKYSPQYKELLSVTSFDLILDNDDYEISDIKEYQNRLYISDLKKGVLVFDNLGNYFKTIPIKGIKKISFYREFLLVPVNQDIRLYNIYESVFKPEKFILQGDWERIVCGEKHVYLLKKDQVTVYDIVD